MVSSTNPPRPDPSAEQPIAWCVSWTFLPHGFRLKKRPPPDRAVFALKVDAETHKRSLKARNGDAIVICITPVYISPAKRSRRFDERQLSTATGWPLQHRPTPTDDQ